MTEQVWVPVAAVTDRWRLRPHAEKHVQMLMEIFDHLPPLLVEAGTLMIVDGHLRRDAALALNRSEVCVTLVEGTAVKLLQLAIEANTAHGLPLALHDRRASAVRLLTLEPTMSSRRVATTCGVSEGTVRKVRAEMASACPGAQDPYVDSRCGADGKNYPVDSGNRRQRAAELLAADPRRSDRDVGREVALSPTTVARVRLSVKSHPPLDPAVPSSQLRSSMRQAWFRRTLLRVLRWWRRLERPPV